MRLRRFPFRAMGSPCELLLYGSADVGAVAEAAMAEVARLERKYSRYREDSLASCINRSAGDPRGVELDEESARLLDYAQTAYEQSGGLFDVTSGILRRAWDLESGRVPSRRELDALLRRVGWQRVRWQSPRLVLPLEGMEVDFGGYVKEYTADRLGALCRARGVHHGVVDLGGDLHVLGPHPDGRPWQVGIRDPRRRGRSVATIALARGGLATSGDYERCMVVDGRRYGHILDPRSGWPVSGLAGASVAAGTCLVAGTASTVAMLKGARAGAAWLAELGLPHLTVTGDGALGGTLAPAGTPAPRSAAPSVAHATG